MSSLTIVMYHYVRPIAQSDFPRIKGLELDGFKRQLDFLLSKFQIVTAEDVISAVKSRRPLPEDSCWLTFDDGYKDHYLYVLPELLKRGIQGSFFPPTKPIIERTMLDVNSVHFILASAASTTALITELNRECEENGISHKELCSYWSAHAVDSRYDGKEIIYIKRMLQHALPEALRNSITSSLFRKFVGISQREFAERLYMSKDEVKKLVDVGMYVGSHGFRHLWMNKEDSLSQKMEIESSIHFLSEIGARCEDWIMCYPYGAFNAETIRVLEELKCAVGITTEAAKADLKSQHPLKLPRLDTNDFPQ